MNVPGRNSWRQSVSQRAPRLLLNGFRQLRSAWSAARQRTIITAPCGLLEPHPSRPCALLVVGRNFDQRKPDAMMTCRLGYAKAFESLGIPYMICDWRDLPRMVKNLPQAFALVFGADVPEMSEISRAALAQIPHATWVNPWFKGEKEFFASHQLPAETWVWPREHREAILALQPRFVFTATVPSGLGYFEQWSDGGLPVQSLPLACDTSLYCSSEERVAEFNGVELAFVGGYWDSKGKALDQYLRPFEDQLVIYGYNRWPYRGYRGKLLRECEPALYREARVCPVVNEPTVALLKGQINERVFKVLGSGGVAAVDAVPAYRELFTEDELWIPRDIAEFAADVRQLLQDEELRRKRGAIGRAAVMARHTYLHRARSVIHWLGIGDSLSITPS